VLKYLTKVLILIKLETEQLYTLTKNTV